MQAALLHATAPCCKDPTITQMRTAGANRKEKPFEGVGLFPQSNLKLCDCLSITHQNLQAGVNLDVVHHNICTAPIKTRLPRNTIWAEQKTF